MAESLDPVERVPESPQHRRVNPTDQSNPEKKDNGFSSALKEKMKEKLKERAREEDEIILEEDKNDEGTEVAEAERPEDGENGKSPEDEDSDEQEIKHVDLKA